MLLTSCYTDDIMEDEVDGTCGMYGGEEKYVQVFGGET